MSVERRRPGGTPGELVERVLAVLQADNAFFDGGMGSALQLPWELTPAQFLDFADADLTEPSDDRALVNALSNANRALHCQVDSILFSLGLYDTTRSKRFPSKLELLSRLGIVTRNALERLNESRNLTEHEYAIPVETEVRLFSDVVPSSSRRQIATYESSRGTSRPTTTR